MLVGFWIPFLAADLGNFLGHFSSYLIRRGWPVVAARKLLILICGLGMTALIPAVFISSFAVIATLYAVSTFCYAAWSTMCLALPSDPYPSSTVASVSGLSGTNADVGTITSIYLISWVPDRYSFEPILVGASLVPLLANALVFLLIRERRHDRSGQPASTR